MISDRLGLVLKQLRLDRELSQQTLADTLGVQRGYLSRVECGKTVPAWENMERFAATFGVSVWEIIRLAEGPVRLVVDKRVHAESASSQCQVVGVPSSRTESPETPILATIESVDGQHLVQRDQHGKLRRVPLSSVQWGTGSRGSNGGEGAGTDIYRVSGDAHPTPSSAPSQPESPLIEDAPTVAPGSAPATSAVPASLWTEISS